MQCVCVCADVLFVFSSFFSPLCVFFSFTFERNNNNNNSSTFIFMQNGSYRKWNNNQWIQLKRIKVNIKFIESAISIIKVITNAIIYFIFFFFFKNWNEFQKIKIKWYHQFDSSVAMDAKGFCFLDHWKFKLVVGLAGTGISVWIKSGGKRIKPNKKRVPIVVAIERTLRMHIYQSAPFPL